MAVCVDRAAVLWRGRRRHHLAGATLAELHAFAEAVGISRCWFHNAAGHPHYDVTDEQRLAAIAAGADAVSSRALLKVAKGCRKR